MAITIAVTFTPYNNDTPFSVPATGVSFAETNMLNIGSQSSGAGAGKVVFQPLILTRLVDAHSPTFLTYIASGKVFEEVKIEFSQASPLGQPKPFYLVALKLVGISRIDQTVTGDAVQETLELRYGALQLTYTGLDAKGAATTPPTTAQWNAIKNTATFDA